MAIRFALLSTYDKSGLLPLVDVLSKHKYRLIASKGTAGFLRENGVEVETVEKITGYPSMLGGRLKTLHPKIFGGILALGSEEELKKYEIPLIDMVVVNLYPFETEPSIENIDIGGVSLIRAASKNYERTACLVDPADYSRVIGELDSEGAVSHATRLYLARKAFSLSAGLDRKISMWLGHRFHDIQLDEISKMRYGENPHQEATLFRETGYRGLSIIDAQKIQGKKISFNNICDLDTALSIICSFKETAACIIKHSSPCGIAVSPRLLDAYKLARSCDPMSSFGGIVGLNRKVTVELARELTSTFLEAVLAPSYDDEAKAVLSNKKRLILLELPLEGSLSTVNYRYLNGGFLKQDSDESADDVDDYEVVTNRKPTEKEFKAMCFAFNVVRFVRSNSVCITRENMTVGIGGGQPSRIGALEIAIKNKKRFGFKECIALASDGFFPFRDSIDLAAEEGITAVIQPGGSIRDKEVIGAADEHGLAMIFTHRRHFRH